MVRRALIDLYYSVMIFLAPGTARYSIGGSIAEFYLPRTGMKPELDSVADSEETMIEDVLSNIEPEDVFFEIGAHLGLYSGLVAAAGATVVAFEPNLGRSRILRKNLRRNGCATKILEIALSDATMRDGDVTGDHAPVCRGDAVIRDYDLPNPTVIKIDIEGMELRAIRGLSEALQSPDCRVVYIEIHPESVIGRPRGLNADEIDRLHDTLRNYGYELRVIQEREGQQFIRASRIPKGKY